MNCLCESLSDTLFFNIHGFVFTGNEKSGHVISQLRRKKRKLYGGKYLTIMRKHTILYEKAWNKAKNAPMKTICSIFYVAQILPNLILLNVAQILLHKT